MIMTATADESVPCQTGVSLNAPWLLGRGHFVHRSVMNRPVLGRKLGEATSSSQTLPRDAQTMPRPYKPRSGGVGPGGLPQNGNER